MTSALVKPGVYEVLTGPNGKVIHAHSISDARREWRNLVKQGSHDAAIYLGEMHIEGPPLKEYV